MIIYKHGENVFEPQKSAYITPESTSKLSASETKILQYLIENSGEIISREKLLEIGWPDKVVVANSLNVAIANLRKAFRSKAEVIITIKGAGFTVAKNTFIEHPDTTEPQTTEGDADTTVQIQQEQQSDSVTANANQQADYIQPEAAAPSSPVTGLSGIAKFGCAVSLLMIVAWVALWAGCWQTPPCIFIDGREVCGNIELLELDNLPKNSEGKLYIDMLGELHEEN